MTDAVTIYEVGPRDGLQNEPAPVPVAARLGLIEALAEAGLREVEVGSFVSPKWVPQMAGSDAVLAAAREIPGIRPWVLVPNMKGWEAFEAAGAGAGVAVFVSASEGFSRANLNCSVDESLDRLRPVAEAARAAGVPLRGYVSCLVACPYDGPVAPEAVARVARGLAALGIDRLSLGDTIGAGEPETVRPAVRAALECGDWAEVAGHFHDTGGRALANVEACLDLGLRAFDAAAGGLGGCPYAPGAPGNLATEALVARLHALGMRTGVDEARLARAAAMARGLRGGDR